MINEGGNETSKLSEFVDTPSCNLGKFTVNPIVEAQQYQRSGRLTENPLFPI